MDISVEMLGKRAFSEAIMRERLPKAVFKQLKKTLDYGAPLDVEIADSVAIAMREWAKELGATHYTHWFQPLTNLTAEKHDSFMDPVGDGTFITEFTGKELIKAEPDGSSFPTGGVRNTCSARGYTVWDCTSPAFVKDIPNGCKVLCIPTIFISYTGESLDFKTPLLRSMEAVSNQAKRILKLFGKEDIDRINASVGVEQEYFLIDKSLYERRLDLKLTGRTLYGAPGPKGQEMEDQYFSVVKDKVSHFMNELNQDLWAYGIPAKTQHNEAAPAQHEIAPIFETTNIACDQNQLVMDTLKRVAARTGFACLLHEKPFRGVNGSGKHNNWSLSTSDGENLVSPGKNPEKNLQFHLFLAAVLAAVHNNAELLRLSAASPGNDHRLGGDEAPPAIISVYLGDQLDDIVNQIIENGEVTKAIKGRVYEPRCSAIPQFKMDATDRNRTSPFAFTGNRFEFRMVGSSQSIGLPMTTMNTIVANTLCDMADELEKADDFEAAAKKMVADMIREHKDIIFNGNGYSEEWVKEAERRGLPNIPTTVDAIPYLTSDKALKTFGRFGIMNESELRLRENVLFDSYAKTINLEALTMIEMANKQIIPAVMDYEAKAAAGIKDLKSIGVSANAQVALVNELDERLTKFRVAIVELKKRVDDAVNHNSSPKEWATYYRDYVAAYMDVAREPADELEKLVGEKDWPLPTYEEFLFEQ
ncbi:MAG: glutamine synthetase III [Lachnospiraceae bacterium]|nr:glutamine synthetase III [Lachnospiraceae bacterium]